MRKVYNHKPLTVPVVLTEIPDAPRELYALQGEELNALLSKPRVAIIGSRKMSAYGKHATDKIARELVARDVVIVSGLAYGVDACAHQATVDAGGKAIAVLACGLDRMYPAANSRLAKAILASGGVILSEYKTGVEPFKAHFLARNRLISGLADAVIIPEAAARSGSLNTAAHALNQGKPVFAVPGPITQPLSEGTNNLIKQGAHVLTDTEDVFEELGLNAPNQTVMPLAQNEQEYVILSLLKDGVTDGAELLHKSELEAYIFNQTLTMLELAGSIKPLGNNQWSLA